MSAWRADQKDLLKHGLDDLELLGSGGFTIGVPEEMPPEFKKMVFAAAKAFEFGYSSIDYTLRKYGSLWDIETIDQPTRRMRKAIHDVRKHVVATIDYVTAIPGKPKHANLFACTAALFRLQNTFRAAVITIKSGLHFETASLLRMIMEQLAWIVAIRHMTPDKGDYFKVSPQSCIGELKRITPTAGRVYGDLSELSHMHPEATKRYIHIEGEKVSVHLHSREFAWLDTLYLLKIADLFSIIGEWTYSGLVTQHRFIDRRDKAEWRPNPSRVFLKTVEDYKTGILRDLESSKSSERDLHR